MRKFRNLLVTCVLLTMTATLCACVPTATTGKTGGKSSESSKIVVGIPQDLEDSLDPHKAVAAGTKEVLFNVFEGLVKPDTEGNIVPAVAESYEISEDGKTFTFVIRKDVKFHNGNLVTAEDIKYSIEKSAGKLGDESSIPAFSAIESVNVVSDNTVEIVLTEQDPDFMSYLAMTNASIIPKDNLTPDTTAIGTGPYKMVSRTPQEKIVLESFDEYWGEKAFIKDVTLKIVANADSIIMDLKGGSIDMYCRLTTTQVDQLGDGFDVLEGTMNLVQALYLNNAVEPFNDVRVRQAMNYAIDINEILELTSEGKGTPIGSSMFPAFKKYYMEELNDVYTQDIEKAKELLKEAGYPDGFDMTITVPSNYQPHIDTAQVIVEQFKKVGINATIQLVEWNSWLSDVYTDRNYESTVIGVDASYMTARALLERFNSEAHNNFINYSNAEYDEYYKKAISTTDDAVQTESYKAMESILTNDAANVYLQDMAEFVALRKGYTGYEFYPLYVMDLAKIRVSETAQ